MHDDAERPEPDRADELARPDDEPERERRAEAVAARRASIRAASTSASMARNATSGCGWNIAAVFSTIGQATKKATAAKRSQCASREDDRAQHREQDCGAHGEERRRATGRGRRRPTARAGRRARRAARRGGRIPAACSSCASSVGMRHSVTSVRAYSMSISAS